PRRVLPPCAPRVRTARPDTGAPAPRMSPCGPNGPPGPPAGRRVCSCPWPKIGRGSRESAGKPARADAPPGPALRIADSADQEARDDRRFPERHHTARLVAAILELLGALAVQLLGHLQQMPLE